MVTGTLSPGFGGLSGGNAVSGRTPSVLNPISSTIESAVRAITVPSRRWEPGSLLREWLCSYSEKISLKDSTGSTGSGTGWPVFGAAGVFGSDIPVSDVLGLDSGLIMERLRRLRRDPALG